MMCASRWGILLVGFDTLDDREAFGTVDEFGMNLTKGELFHGSIVFGEFTATHVVIVHAASTFKETFAVLFSLFAEALGLLRTLSRIP